jgi:hypothetical protein
MNLFRVYAIDERAPTVLGKLAANFDAESLLNRLTDTGIIFIEAELIAIFNVANLFKNILATKPLVREDI